METAARIRDFDDPTYDPFMSDDAAFGTIVDPYSHIAEWRARGPVFQGSYHAELGMEKGSRDHDHYVVIGSNEITEALTDTSRFSNGAYKLGLGTSFGMGSISVMDHPEHGRWRRIFQKIFLPQNVKSWGGTIVDPVVSGLMDKFIPRGEADLVEEFTLRYPFEVIYRQLALPERDLVTFQRLALAQTDYSQNPDKAIEAGQKLGEYFVTLVDERRARPGDDLVSILANTEVDGEYLPELVLISFLRQLMNAAGDTTYRGTSVLLTGLLENPDQLEAIRQDRSLIPHAIEEGLRWEGPVAVQTRMASVDTELGGVRIPKGAIIDVVAAAANRDPAIYPDPNKFDILRSRKPHWSFARGPHICVGQHLARLEMTRAMHAILDNLANLRLNPDRPAPQIRGASMRVPRHIHVRFG